MLQGISEANSLARKHDVPLEDILFTDMSLSGVFFSLPYIRIRFEFIPEDSFCFENSIERKIENYFFALPVSYNSLYRIEGNRLMMNGRLLGLVKNVREDTCDSSYVRRKGTVFVFNPVPKSSCSGCKFCHTIKQTGKEEESLLVKGKIRQFLNSWMNQNSLSGLSHLIQVSVVTGCFGSEKKVIEHLKILRDLFYDFDFQGKILYYGSEITSEKGIDELKNLRPITLYFSVECFKDRERMLKYTKGRLGTDQIRNILAKAQRIGCETRFSYIVGIESLEAIKQGFNSFLPYINCFPVVNVFQVHKGQGNLRFNEARKMDYYLKARKSIEEIFGDTNMRPAPWENYRSLWHLTFGKEQLNDIRTPS